MIFSYLTNKIKDLVVSKKSNLMNLKSFDLSNIIDSIEIKGNDVLIKTSKNIIIENAGNTINITKGFNIQIADEIHLNPEIPLNDILSKKWKSKHIESLETKEG